MAFGELFTNLDIPPAEVQVFVRQMLGLATSCEERYLAELETTPYWDFIEAGSKSNLARRSVSSAYKSSSVASGAGSSRRIPSRPAASITAMAR